MEQVRGDFTSTEALPSWTQHNQLTARSALIAENAVFIIMD